MKKLVGLLVVALTATAAFAQPYNVRGGMNGWGESQMNNDGDGTYSLTIGSLNPGDRHNFKVAFNDWASSWPGSDARYVVNGAGQMTFHFIPGAIADGWNPGGDRVGHDDAGAFSWEVVGDFTDWGNGPGLPVPMVNNGGGLWTANYTMATPGLHDFKFRETGSWDVSRGADFGNASGNAQVTTTLPNEIIQFQLDLPNGRWRVIPEPMTMTLIGSVLGLVALRRRR